MTNTELLENVFPKGDMFRDVIVNADHAALLRAVELFLKAGWQMSCNFKPIEPSVLPLLLEMPVSMVAFEKDGVTVNAFFGNQDNLREFDFDPREIDATNVATAVDALMLIARAVGHTVHVTPEGRDEHVVLIVHADRLEAVAEA